MMRASLLFVAGALMLGTIGATAAQKPKPKPKPKPPGLGSIGTTQLPGAICKFGTAYTLGTAATCAINVNITKAEYVSTRVKTAKNFRFPKADTKLLVVYFTLHNPMPKQQWYQKFITFTAVSPQGQNFETWDVYVDAAPNPRMDYWLKPAQKIACYAIIEVPGNGPMDKLMLENRASKGSLVARYPLAGVVKPIGAPYVDSADSSGATPLKLIKANMGETYQIADSDVSVVKVEQVEGAKGSYLGPRNAKETYVLVTYQLTCRNEDGGWMTNLGGGWLYNQVVDTDGGGLSGNNNASLRATSIESFNPRSNFGEMVTFRKAYIAKRGVRLDYVRLKTFDSREIRWDLGGFTTQ